MIKSINFFNFFICEFTTLEIVAIAFVALLLLIVIGLCIANYLKKRKLKGLQSSKKSVGVKIIENTRYTSDESGAPDTSNNLEFYPNDIIIKVGETYTACKDSNFKPGKYKILSTDENVIKFNIRIGSFVREYLHNTDIVIAEGESITPVSHKIILR